MADRFEVIAAFVDGERVDPEALKDALSVSEGRDYLAEIVALGEVVGGEAPAVAASMPGPSRGRMRWLAAAAVVLGLAGGYVLGQQYPRTAVPDVASRVEEKAPAPTKVIELKWQESQGGN